MLIFLRRGVVNVPYASDHVFEVLVGERDRKLRALVVIAEIAFGDGTRDLEAIQKCLENLCQS